MEEQFDAIVVGAGPAGVSAALIMARAGMNVIVFEKGRHPGSKNFYGGILFTPVLEELVPNFINEAPLERRIVNRRFGILGRDAELSIDFKTSRWKEPPHNHMFTAFRVAFDRWFSEQAEKAGAFLVNETVVTDFLYEDGKIVGVRTDRADGDLKADIIIIAEGANSLLTEKAGLKPKPGPKDFAVAVKETLKLPKEVIEDRFHLSDDEGAALEYFGDSVKGIVGSAFIYTFKEHISVGIGYSIADGIKAHLDPHDVLEHFKNHPVIRPLIRGGKAVEYGAHMIPEGGINAAEKTKLFTDHVMVVGDAASFVNTNPLYHEGTNLAMETGKLAGEVAVAAHKRGDFSAESLKEYEQKVKASWAWKDLEQYRHLTDFVEGHPHLLKEYPDILLDALHEIFTMDKSPKRVVECKAVEKIGQLMRAQDLLDTLDTFSDQELLRGLIRESRKRISVLTGLKLGWKLWRAARNSLQVEVRGWNEDERCREGRRERVLEGK